MEPRGVAPRFTHCECVVLLLDDGPEKAVVSLARVALASDPLGEDRSWSIKLQGHESGGAPGTRTPDTLAGATVSRQLPRLAGRAPCEKWLLSLASHQAHTA